MGKIEIMDSLITHLFIDNWQKKCVALLIATVIWVFVNHSITATKVIPSVPIRVINLPIDKTILGLLPNGFLSKRTTLTVHGTKDVVEQLEPGDLEILLDVSHQPNEGIVQISKKNLISLNPDINLANHITSVSHPEFVLKLSSILTEKIPITINPPTGSSPKEYDYLDIWPITLMQTITGAQEQVLELKNKGLELTFNLNDITKEQLDALHASQTGPYDDEVNFPIPDQWKKIVIPFLSQIPEPLNDLDAKNLHINFLYQAPIEIKRDIPIHVFYPLKYISQINPRTYGLIPTPFIQFDYDIPVLRLPLFAHHISKLFFEVIKDSLELQIAAAPKVEREKLEWSIGFIDEPHLENAYVALLLNLMKTHTGESHLKLQEREQHCRERFRFYRQKFSLYISPDYPLKIEGALDDQQITIHIPNATPLPISKESNA